MTFFGHIVYMCLSLHHFSDHLYPLSARAQMTLLGPRATNKLYARQKSCDCPIHGKGAIYLFVY